METKAPLPVAHLAAHHVSPLIEAYFEFNHLKQLYRQGWLQRGISPGRCESVAEHTFAVAMLALFLAETYVPTLNALKVLRMALLHDLGEIYVGDLTPADGVSPEDKQQRERQSITQVLQKLPQGATYVAVWEEYEQGESPEARFIRQLDRLEMALQASVYEHQGLADLSEFFTSVEHVLTDPALREILQELEALR